MPKIWAHGESLQEAWDSLKPMQKNNRTKLRELPRTTGIRAEVIVDTYNGKLGDDEALVCESSYNERREYKAMRGMAHKRARVWVFMT